MEQQRELIGDAGALIGRQAYLTKVKSKGHEITVDEPAELGGGDQGIAPYGLLLGSLASCTAITLRMYIERKMWVVEDIAVNVEMFKTEDGNLIETRLRFTGELTADQRKRLVTIANACPIHKILAGNITINTSISEV